MVVLTEPGLCGGVEKPSEESVLPLTESVKIGTVGGNGEWWLCIMF